MTELVKSGELEETRLRQTGYDLATLFRVVPWIFLMGDQRPPATLVRAALAETREFIEAHASDPNRDRRALMRGLLINWLQAMGASADPRAIETITTLVAQAVDEIVTSQYDDGLTGEQA